MLFNNDKDFVLKLTNIVLILWLIGAISALQFSLTDLFLKEPKLSLSEYKTYYCFGYRDLKDVVETPEVNDCDNQYEMYEIEHARFDSNKLKFVIMALGNVVIVSTALYFINKERK